MKLAELASKTFCSESVHAFLEELQNRSKCKEGKECENNEQEYASNEDDGEGDTVCPKTDLSGTLAINH